MKPWREVIVPHRDIREGRFDESVFAADLSDVVADRGPMEYRDAELFFRKTFPTQGIVNLLAAIVSRLSGQGRGQPVIQIQTPFGGGKTHSLIALYHLFKEATRLKSSDAISRVLKEAGVASVPEAQVVTFIGTAADPVKGKTPWGELADQLGEYQRVRANDQKRRAPGKDLLHKLLAQKPTLILMDEIEEYAVKAQDFRGQVIAFFQELTETVKVLPRCALVVTLPSSAPYGEEGERALHELQMIFGRQEAIYTPVEGEEIYEVIRRRLFEDAPDPAEIKRVADSYWELYQRLGDDLPREVRQPAYREKLRKAYPFHPELIDLLFERWSTFATFQRTRGVLRLLADVIGDLYRREHAAPLIQPAHVNLVAPTIRREFLKHIGNEFEGVIADDIVGGSANAQKLDQEMGSEYARFGIASGLATAIFVGSFSGSEKKGIGIQRLRMAILREGIPPAVVGDALRRLEDELWYLHAEGGLYLFSNQPNLNRVLIEKEQSVREEHITEEIRSRIEKGAGNELRVTVWPRVSQDVPDTKDLKLAVLGLEHARPSEQTDHFVNELLKKAGTPFRTYQNTLLILAPDAGELATLRQQTKRLLALRAIQQDKALIRRLSEENRKGLETRLKDTDSDLNFRVLATYRHLAKADEADVAWFNLGLPTVGERSSLAKCVRDYLKTQDILLEAISPRQVIQKALKTEDQEKPLGEVWDAFLRYPNLPILDGYGVLQDSVRRGVSERVFAVRVGEQVYADQEIPSSLLDSSAVLVRNVPAKVPTPDDVEISPPVTPPGPPTTAVAVARASGIKLLRLRVKVPWDKLSDFVRGVVMPLRQDNAQLNVEVNLEAQSESGTIRPSTVDHKVKETLNQIGAQVLEDTRE